MESSEVFACILSAGGDFGAYGFEVIHYPKCVMTKIIICASTYEQNLYPAIQTTLSGRSDRVAYLTPWGKKLDSFVGLYSATQLSNTNIITILATEPG